MEYIGVLQCRLFTSVPGPNSILFLCLLFLQLFSFFFVNYKIVWHILGWSSAGCLHLFLAQTQSCSYVSCFCSYFLFYLSTIRFSGIYWGDLVQDVYICSWPKPNLVRMLKMKLSNIFVYHCVLWVALLVAPNIDIYICLFPTALLYTKLKFSTLNWVKV